MLGGCAVISEAVWPTAPAEPAARGAAGADDRSPTAAAPVGERLGLLRRDVDALQARLADHDESLRRIRAGAGGDAEPHADTVAARNGLADTLAAEAGTATYLLAVAGATYLLPGAAETDHRQLAALEIRVRQAQAQADRLLGQLGRAAVTARRDDRSPRPSRPLVVIRFDSAGVAYQEPLYTAMSKALERYPAARFGLVAVTPGGRSSAEMALNQATSRRHAEAVLRSMTEMGLPPGRVSLSATTSLNARSSEIHVYVHRTSSDRASR